MASTQNEQTDQEDFDLLLALRKATRRSHHVANALILTKLVVALTDRTLYAQALSRCVCCVGRGDAAATAHALVQ